MVLSRVVSETRCHRNYGQWLDSPGTRQECSACSFLCGAAALVSASSRLGHFGVVFAVDVLAERNGEDHPQQLEQVMKNGNTISNQTSNKVGRKDEMGAEYSGPLLMTPHRRAPTQG